MATQEHLSYLKVKKLVITDLKSEAKIGSTQSTHPDDWTGGRYYTNAKLKKEIERRKKLKKGYKMLLEAFKLLNY
jgi:hypothetical protein